MTIIATKPKLVLRLKDPRRFLVNQEQEQQKIFETFVEWTAERLIDEVFLSLMSTRVQYCMINEQDDRSGVLRRLYDSQARYKMYRMPVFRPPPSFVIHLKHLDERVKRELAKRGRELRDFILMQVAERIFEQTDSRYFQLSVKPFLRVRLEP